MLQKNIKKTPSFRKAYVQMMDGQFVNDAAFYYCNGLKLLNIPIEFFDEDKPYELNIDRETLIVAGVPTTIKAFKTIGVEPPKPLEIPLELHNYAGRWMMNVTLRDVVGSDTIKYPIFVKPSSHGKLFNGQLVHSKSEIEMFRHCSEELDLDIPITISEPVNFLSEYRAFVLDGKIIDCRKYAGDFRIAPNYKKIEQAVADYTRAPIAYAIDFGITDDGRTLLVECNDAFSLGPYGFDNLELTKMFIARWNEIIGNKLILTNK